MNEISMSEIKEIALNTLLYFDDFCRQHNLTYYLAYGTLIGAIRHQGYIPWDDDIDVWMLRDDYQKLIELNQYLDHNHYQLNCIQCNELYAMPFAKLTKTGTVILPARFITGYLYGLSIDIFPLDTIGDYENEEEAHQALLSIKNAHLPLLNKYHHLTGGKKEKLIKKMAKKTAYYLATKQYGPLPKHMRSYADALMNLFPNATGQYVATIDDKVLLKKEWFRNTVMVAFEGHQLPAPIEYDKVLHKQYGDYMSYPPIEQQVKPHTYKAYHLD